MRAFHYLKWNCLHWLIRLKFPSVRQISTVALAAWLTDENRQPPLLLDTRSPLEYAVSHLKHAQFCSSVSQASTNFPSLSFSTPIVTYCSVGYRSAIAAQQLQKMGYEQVFNLQGSLFAWFSENRPVYQENQPVSQIHPYNRFWSLWLEN